MHQGNDMANSFYVFISVLLFISKFSWKKAKYYINDYFMDFKKEYSAFIGKVRHVSEDNISVEDEPKQKNVEIDDDYNISTLKEE